MKHFTFCAMLLALLTIAGCNPVTYDVFASICGTVADSETMEPIEGVSVVLSPSGKNKVTKADGHFEFTELDAIQYTIMVQKAGYSTNRKTVSAVAGETIEISITMDKKQ